MTPENGPPADAPLGADPTAWARIQADQVAHRQRLDDARARVTEHPFALTHRRVEVLRVGLQEILVPNARELDQLLAASAADFDLAVELVQNTHRSLVAE